MFEIVRAHLVTAQAAAQQEETLSIVEIIGDTSGVVLGAIIVLALMSLGSWYIIGYKWYYLRRARRESERFLEHFWQSKRLDAIYEDLSEYEEAPVGQVFKSGYIELTKLKEGDEDQPESMRSKLSGIENVERALRRAIQAEMTHLESLVPYLATVGSTAPFVGLFGTVWGIMVAFVNIDVQGAAGLDVVAQPIAEALIVTAVGLFTAIPAVIANNYFTNKVRIMGSEMNNFSDDFLNIVKRHFFE